MITALELLKKGKPLDFINSFYFVTGAVDEEAKIFPEKPYTAKEVAELFNHLFEMRYETPAAGTAGESKVTRKY